MSDHYYFDKGVVMKIIEIPDGSRTILINGHEYRGIKHAQVDIQPGQITTVTVTFMPSKIDFEKGFTAATKEKNEQHTD